MAHAKVCRVLTRRDALETQAAAIGALFLAAAGAEVVAPSASRAQTQLTSDEALKELLAGNKRFHQWPYDGL